MNLENRSHVISCAAGTANELFDSDGQIIWMLAPETRTEAELYQYWSRWDSKQ